MDGGDVRTGFYSKEEIEPALTPGEALLPTHWMPIPAFSHIDTGDRGKDFKFDEMNNILDKELDEQGDGDNPMYDNNNEHRLCDNELI